MRRARWCGIIPHPCGLDVGHRSHPRRLEYLFRLSLHHQGLNDATRHPLMISSSSTATPDGNDRGQHRHNSRSRYHSIRVTERRRAVGASCSMVNTLAPSERRREGRSNDANMVLGHRRAQGRHKQAQLQRRQRRQPRRRLGHRRPRRVRQPQPGPHPHRHHQTSSVCGESTFAPTGEGRVKAVAGMTCAATMEIAATAPKHVPDFCLTAIAPSTFVLGLRRSPGRRRIVLRLLTSKI